MRLHDVAAGAVAALLAAVLVGCEPTGKPEPSIEPSAPTSPSVIQSLVGPGCASYVKAHATGSGSPSDLADKSLANALAAHPQLTEFSRAMTGKLNARVNLADELDGGEFTVFAPTDAAFAKLPDPAVRSLAAAKSVDALTELLMFHLVVGERAPSGVIGELETRGGEKLKVVGGGDRIRVGDQANVVCGGIHTANATLYLIDTVLMPHG
jgi:uncharacterized surface protein with fasciclin (FAS1) repeats